MNWLAQTVSRLDQIKPSWLLGANGVFAAFILLAHGGALLLVRAGKGDVFGESASILYVTVPLAAGALALALLAALYSSSRAHVLKVHAFLLIGAAIFMLGYALDVIATGIPTDARFTWNPVLFGLLLAYPVYLGRRVLVSPEALEYPAIKYAHVIALALSVPLSIIIMWRIYASAI